MWIMRRKKDAQYFIKRRPNTGLGDLMTNEPNKACLYTCKIPAGFTIDCHLWESIEVDVQVKLKKRKVS